MVRIKHAFAFSKNLTVHPISQSKRIMEVGASFMLETTSLEQFSDYIKSSSHHLGEELCHSISFVPDLKSRVQGLHLRTTFHDVLDCVRK